MMMAAVDRDITPQRFVLRSLQIHLSGFDFPRGSPIIFSLSSVRGYLMRDLFFDHSRFISPASVSPEEEETIMRERDRYELDKARLIREMKRIRDEDGSRFNNFRFQTTAMRSQTSLAKEDSLFLLCSVGSQLINMIPFSELVGLIGYCAEGARRMLVYEFVDNGNLEQWLHGDVGPLSPLTWEIRMKIAIGTTRGSILSTKWQDVEVTKALQFLEDGTLVAKSDEVEFTVQEGHFCPALAKAMKTMKIGEKVLMTVKSQYGFGEKGKPASGDQGAIPPNATLNINLELVSWKTVFFELVCAGNLGNWPLIVIQAVCQETNSPFGDSSTCSTNGQAYVSLSMAIGAVFIWSYVYNIIRAYAIGSVDSTINICYSDRGSAMLPQSSLEQVLLSKNSVDNEDIQQAQDVVILTYCTEDNIKVPLHKKIKQQLKSLSKRLNKMMMAIVEL